MALTEHLRKQHAELVEMVGTVAAWLDKPERHVEEISARLSILADRLAAHLALEDDILYPLLAGHAEPKVRDLGRLFTAEMSGVKPIFAAYHTRWTIAEIIASPTVFAIETRTIFGVIENRILRENRELYPVADEAALAAQLCASR